MKRLLFVSAACVALLVPSLASGSSASGKAPFQRAGGALERGFVPDFFGTFDEGGNAGFNVKRGKVKRFTWGNAQTGDGDVPMACDQGAETTTGQFTFGMKIKDGKFSGTALNEGETATARVVGRFVTRRKAKGTLRVHGDFPDDSLTGCDTGKLHWTAKKQ